MIPIKFSRRALFYVLGIFYLCSVLIPSAQGTNFFFHTMGQRKLPPTGLSLTQSPNNRTFSVGWSAGVGNDGPSGCRIEYQKNDATWTTVSSPASVNCDQNGSAAGTITLPGDGWLGTGTWSTSRSIRLIRISDGVIMGTLGSVTCSSKTGSSSLTPNVDEDCNNQWDNQGQSSLQQGGGYWGGRWVTCCACVNGGYSNCAESWSGPTMNCSGPYYDDNPYPPSSYQTSVSCPTTLYF